MDVDEIGAVVNVGGVTLASYRSGSDYGVKAVNSALKATGVYESLEFKAPVKGAEVPTRWKHTEIYMEPLPTGCSVEFWFKVNRASNWTQAQTGSGAYSYSNTGGKKGTFRLGTEGDIFEYKLILNPSLNVTPVILRSRIYFE